MASLANFDVAVAVGCDHTALSRLRNAVSLDLGLMPVIVLPWSVNRLSESKFKKLGPSKQSVRTRRFVFQLLQIWEFITNSYKKKVTAACLSIYNKD